MADDTKAEPDQVVDLTDDAELAALKAENEALRAQIDGQPDQGNGVPLWRKIVAGVLAVLAIIAVVAAVEALWVKTTLENEDQFVSTFEPLPMDDAGAAALSAQSADGVVETQAVQGHVTSLLPSELSFVAAPVTESITEILANGANTLIQSDAVTEVWSSTLRVTHIAVSAVLTGNDRALEAENGVVAVNLDAIASEVVARVEAAGVDLPEGSVELGTVVIYESDQLGAAQEVAQAISTIGWVLPVIALVLIALAVFASSDRRRMAMILAFGSAVALLLSLATYRVARNALLGDIEDPLTRDAAEAVWDTTLARLTAGTWALIVLAVIIGIIAWLAGPSERAVRVRTRGASTIDAWRRPAEEEPSGFTSFLAEWTRTIQVVIGTLGLLFVLFGPDPSGWLVLATAVVVLVLVVLVEVFAGPPAAPAQPELEDAEV